MKKKVSALFAAYHIVFLLIFLAAVLGGKFTETKAIQYVTEEGSEGVETYELTQDEEVTFQLDASFWQVNNLIFKFSGCQNHEAGVLSVKIHNDSEEYYVYEVPTYVFQEDVFYLYTNEVPGLKDAKKYNVTVAVTGLKQGSIFLHGTTEDKLKPFWGVDGSITQTSEELGNVLFVWAIVDIAYIIAALLFLRFYTDELKEQLLNRLCSLGKAVYIRFGVFVVLCVATGVVAYQYAEQVREEQTYEYWTHHNVAEFIHIPIKDGEIIQCFTAGYDQMEQFILWFDHYSKEDEAVVSVTLEDAKGNVYDSWSSSPANFSGEVFCLVASVEKELNKHQKYYLRVSLDNPTSDITVRAVSEDDMHQSVGKLTVGGEEQDEIRLYFFQSYRLHVSYVALWGVSLAITLVLFLLVVFGSEEWALKIWNKVSVLLLLTVSYYNIESLSGNLQTISLLYAFVNCMILLALYFILKSVLPRTAYYLTVIAALIVGLANYYVLQFKGTDLLLSDIQSIPTAISVINHYEFTVTPVVFSSILLSVCLIFVQSTIDAKGNSIYRKIGIRARIAFMVSGIVAFVLIGTSAVVSMKLDDKAIDLFILSKNFSKYGWCYANVFILEASNVERPYNYSDKRVETILSEIEPQAGENTQTIPQNLIVIMNESFSDLSVVGQLKTNQDYMPFIRNLNENTVKGNLHVSTFGGYTCITEYEFLTGNSQYFLPVGSKPYTSVCQDSEEGMVKILQAQGYHAVAMHPYGPSNWERDTVYPALGFDEFLSLDDYTDYELLRKYVSDKGDYQKIIDYYEQFDKDEKLFIFNVTMQNHSGYDINNGAMEKSITIENFESAVGETYLSLVKESDEAFAYLLSYFSEVEEPTMIVMFGDHQPALSDNFYESLYGKEMNQRNVLEMSLQYITPYLIWTNYDSDFEQIGDISANYLGSYVMECAGVEMPEYSRFLLKQREMVPVMGMYGIYDADGQYIPYEEVPDDMLNAYEVLQYMRVEDRKSKFYNIFSID